MRLPCFHTKTRLMLGGCTFGPGSSSLSSESTSSTRIFCSSFLLPSHNLSTCRSWNAFLSQQKHMLCSSLCIVKSVQTGAVSSCRITQICSSPLFISNQHLCVQVVSDHERAWKVSGELGPSGMPPASQLLTAMPHDHHIWVVDVSVLVAFIVVKECPSDGSCLHDRLSSLQGGKKLQSNRKTQLIFSL